jgi:hypothetical protein
MNLEQIKAAVSAGLKVCWKNGVYRVRDDHACASGMAIVYDEGGAKENRIGLTWSDAVTLNGEPDEFYVHRDSLSYAVDTALAEVSPHDAERVPDQRYIGFMKGMTMVWVAVNCYLGGTLDDDVACELAIDLLLEKKWFADESKTEPWVVI